MNITRVKQHFQPMIRAVINICFYVGIKVKMLQTADASASERTMRPEPMAAGSSCFRLRHQVNIASDWTNRNYLASALHYRTEIIVYVECTVLCTLYMYDTNLPQKSLTKCCKMFLKYKTYY